MKTIIRILLVAIALAIIVVVGIRIAESVKKNAPADADVDPTTVVRAHTIAKGPFTDEVKVSGTIRPANEVDIYPKIPGRIVKMSAEVGDDVNAHQVLGVIEHNELLLQEKSARAALAIARANEKNAANDLARSKRLFSERVVSEAQLEGAQLKYDMAKAQTLSAAAQAEIAAQQVANAKITSPIAGTVVRRHANVGSNVSPQAPVFSVQDISTLKFVTSVDAATLAKLKRGTQASFTLGSSDTFRGTISTLSPNLDPRSRRAAVEIDIEEADQSLIPNLFVDGSLILGTLENVLLVPNQAIDLTQTPPRVYRIVNHKIEIITPELGASNQQLTVVKSGLNAGDQVVVGNLERMREGMNVKIEDMAKE